MQESKPRRGRWSVVAALVAVVGLQSGCAVTKLKEDNLRLRESNDRLVTENNRLEHELAALQARRHGVVPESAPAPAPAVTKSRDIAPAPAPAPSAMVAEVDADVFPEPSARPEIVRTLDGIVFRFEDRVFFGLGQSALSSQGQRVLEKMASLLTTQYRDHLVRVDGHTDDIPIRKLRDRFPSNWELSTARACTVVRYLVDKAGVSPNRIYPAGFAYFRPLATGKGSQSRDRNRRVEITVLDRT